MLYYSIYFSPIGKLTLASDGESLIGLWIEGQKYFKSTIETEMIRKDDLLIFKKTNKWLDKYFNGKKPSNIEIPLKPLGGEFRQIVWKELLKVPYGKITTYGEIARNVAKIKNKEKMSAQAIGRSRRT